MAQTTSEQTEQNGISRRGFLKGTGIAAVAAAAGGRLAGTASAADPAAVNTPISGPVEITLSLNGQARKVTVEPRTTLLSAIRDRLEPPLTGPKLVCNMGTCGACTVIVEGKAVFGCSVLAIDS